MNFGNPNIQKFGMPVRQALLRTMVAESAS